MVPTKGLEFRVLYKGSLKGLGFRALCKGSIEGLGFRVLYNGSLTHYYPGSVLLGR